MEHPASPAARPQTGLKSRQKARLRHVPVSRRLAAWVAALAHDDKTSTRFVIAFAAIHALLWTMILTALKGAQDLHFDVTEAYAWGRKFLLGYGKHPPLSGWISGIWFRIFPATDWAAYALAMTVAACGLVICWLIARRVVGPRRAMFTVVMLALYPMFNLKGFKYNPDVLQLAMLPLVVLAYLDAFDKRTARSGVWLGLAGAAALLTKYWALTAIGAVGLAALLHPDRLAFLRSPAPWVALVVMLLAISPHLWWLKQVEFAPLIYAGDIYGARPIMETVRRATTYSLHHLAFLLFPVACGAIALAWRLQWWRSLRQRGVIGEFVASVKRPWARGPNASVNLSRARQIWAIALILAIVPQFFAPLFHITVKSDWGIPLFFLVPLALVAIPALRVPQMALIRLMLIWAGFTFIMLVISPIIAAQTVRQHGSAGASFAARSEFALQLTEAWRARFNRRWAVAVASTEAGTPMTFYSPDHPVTFTPGELWDSGLSSLQEAKQRGFIGICDTTDFRLADCEAWMTANADGAENISITARRYFHGKAGPAVRWKIWIVPPLRDSEDE